MKTALILYPHQLYELKILPEVHTVFMVEDPLYFGVDQQFPVHFHKQKLILHRASMRRYVEEVLYPANLNVEYVELDVLFTTADLLKRTHGFEQLLIFDPVDTVLSKRILEARREDPKTPPIEFLATPNFYLKDSEVRDYFGDKHEHLFADFYQWQRERFNILIDENYKPVGGKWSFDSESRKPLPKDHIVPGFAAYGADSYVADATSWVNEKFPHNPGSTDFIWPTNHAEASKWLDEFVETRLDLFGTYEDAIDGQAPWLYHSGLSASLNIGLLQPQQVIEAALLRHQKKPVDLANLEAFIQQILGRREFMRGQYINKGDALRSSNLFKHGRKLTNHWYDGTLEIPPFDDVVNKVNAHAYAHSIERLMIIGNLMMLCEIDPVEVHKWFNEMFIDSYDWVLIPNVYGMSQFADGGTSMADKPYLSSSNYILKMSHYEKGVWSDTWDGLFWRFIDKNRDQIKHNPHMKVMLSRLESLDPDRRRIISYRAEDFLNRVTQ
jgi:deoxyribodipyrimidine photolyase-related protein